MLKLFTVADIVMVVDSEVIDFREVDFDAHVIVLKLFPCPMKAIYPCQQYRLSPILR